MERKLVPLKLIWLVVWNMNFKIFHSVGKVIIPTDEVIFFRGVGIPPTSHIPSLVFGLSGTLNINHWYPPANMATGNPLLNGQD
jgi:hypothetical protein